MSSNFPISLSAATLNADIAARFVAFIMHMLMHNPAFGSQDIFRPDLFDMNQSTLPRTKSVVLQSGQLNEVVRLKHTIS